MIDGLNRGAHHYRADPAWRQFWRFSRPHTIIGTSLSLLALWSLAAGLDRPDVEPLAGMGFALAWVACLGANVFIVGLNQLSDIAIDRINKPYLPLASGAYSVRTGRVIVGVSLAVSLVAIVVSGAGWLALAVGSSVLLGIAYSLPPLRLKRSNFWAAFCIVAVRSLVVNVLLFAHVARWDGSLAQLPAIVYLLTALMFAFSICITWFKDLPDVAGDAAHAVRTLSVRLGPRSMVRYGAWVLIAALVCTGAYAALAPEAVAGGGFVALGQVACLLAFALALRYLDLADPASIRRFYLRLWGLFFAEYLVFAVAPYTAAA